MAGVGVAVRSTKAVNVLVAWNLWAAAGCFPSFDGLSGAPIAYDSGGTGGAEAVVDAGTEGDESSCQASDEASFDSGSAVEYLHLTFDEGNGYVADDSSGHCQTAILQGGASWATGRVGPHSIALGPKAGSYVQVHTATVDTSGPLSVAMWVRLSALAPNQTMLAIDGKLISAFYLKSTNDRFSFIAYEADDTNAAYSYANAAGPLVVGTWYHLAATFDGADVALYVNGILQDRRAHSKSFAAEGPLAIGRAKWAGGLVDFFSGDVDDVHVYQGVLTDEQVVALASK